MLQPPRDEGFLNRAARNADDGVRPQQSARLRGRDVVGAEVHAVGVDVARQNRVVVDQQQRVEVMSQAAQAVANGFDRRRGARLCRAVDDPRAAAQGRKRDFLVPAAPGVVREDVQPTQPGVASVAKGFRAAPKYLGRMWWHLLKMEQSACTGKYFYLVPGTRKARRAEKRISRYNSPLVL
jgi:hypothetical protein